MTRIQALRLPTGLPLQRAALCLVIAMPLAFLYARSLADAMLTVTGALFLLETASRARWDWLRRPWVWLAILFWVWLVLCTLRAGSLHAIAEAVVVVRILLYVVALESWVLAEPQARRWLAWSYSAAALWIALQCWQQLLTGHNIMGDPRWIDGALTGPFYKPRAGPTFLHVFFTGIFPAVVTLLQRPGRPARAGGLALLLLAVATMLLIGQRMPSLLMLLGLVLTGLLIRRFRLPLVIALLAGAVLLALTPVLSPPTYAKLVVKFAEQMSHFARSAYGQLFTRATVMVEQHPLMGLGFDGFRAHCADPRYFRGLPWLGIPDAWNGGLRGCNLHPHNYYLFVASSAGLPGLALFVAMVALWLGQMLRGLRPSAETLRAMLFVASAVALWPIASNTSLFTLSNAGWLFTTVGWSLAAARGGRAEAGQRPAGPAAAR